MTHPGADPAALAARLTGYIRQVEQVWPRAWRQLDQFRAQRGHQLPAWPSWCWLPMAGSVAVVTGGRWPANVRVEEAQAAAELAGLAAWRQGMGIYRFDADLAAALARTELSDSIPPGVLYRLPEWAVYVATGDLVPELCGALVYLEWAVRDKRPELRFLFDPVIEGHEGLMSWPLHLDRPSISEAIESVADVATRNLHEQGVSIVVRPSLEGLKAWIEPVLALVLYLCADDAELVDPDRPDARPARGHRGSRNTTMTTRTWEVGYRLGTALRTARSQPPPTAGAAGAGERGFHAPPRPHVRKAHWHTYWTGPRSGEQTPVVRWLAPIPVNVAADAALIPTIHDVEGRKPQSP